MTSEYDRAMQLKNDIKAKVANIQALFNKQITVEHCSYFFIDYVTDFVDVMKKYCKWEEHQPEDFWKYMNHVKGEPFVSFVVMDKKSDISCFHLRLDFFLSFIKHSLEDTDVTKHTITSDGPDTVVVPSEFTKLRAISSLSQLPDFYACKVPLMGSVLSHQFPLLDLNPFGYISGMTDQGVNRPASDHILSKFTAFVDACELKKLSQWQRDGKLEHYAFGCIQNENKGWAETLLLMQISDSFLPADDTITTLKANLKSINLSANNSIGLMRCHDIFRRPETKQAFIAGLKQKTDLLRSFFHILPAITVLNWKHPLIFNPELGFGTGIAKMVLLCDQMHIFKQGRKSDSNNNNNTNHTVTGKRLLDSVNEEESGVFSCYPDISKVNSRLYDAQKGTAYDLFNCLLGTTDATRSKDSMDLLLQYARNTFSGIGEIDANDDRVLFENCYALVTLTYDAAVYNLKHIFLDEDNQKVMFDNSFAPRDVIGLIGEDFPVYAACLHFDTYMIVAFPIDKLKKMVFKDNLWYMIMNHEILRTQGYPLFWHGAVVQSYMEDDDGHDNLVNIVHYILFGYKKDVVQFSYLDMFKDTYLLHFAAYELERPLEQMSEEDAKRIFFTSIFPCILDLFRMFIDDKMFETHTCYTDNFVLAMLRLFILFVSKVSVTIDPESQIVDYLLTLALSFTDDIHRQQLITRTATELANLKADAKFKHSDYLFIDTFIILLDTMRDGDNEFSLDFFLQTIFDFRINGLKRLVKRPGPSFEILSAVSVPIVNGGGSCERTERPTQEKADAVVLAYRIGWFAAMCESYVRDLDYAKMNTFHTDVTYNTITTAKTLSSVIFPVFREHNLKQSYSKTEMIAFPRLRFSEPEFEPVHILDKKRYQLKDKHSSLQTTPFYSVSPAIVSLLSCPNAVVQSDIEWMNTVLQQSGSVILQPQQKK